MSLIGALTKAAKAGETVKKTAPFYSAVDEALGNLKRPKGTGIEFLTEVLKQPGVKKAEIADRKLEQAFKSKGKMTKEEAQQVLADNPPPKLKEKVYDESTAIDEEDLREMVSQEMFGVPYSDIGFSGARHRQVSDEVYKRMNDDLGTKFGKWKTEGGENYREILLKLPTTRPNASNYSDPAKYDADLKAFNASGKSDYHSSHFADDANILAHMRVQDRKGPNGEKILHVEEIQSDWHQSGRKGGYRNEAAYQEARQKADEVARAAGFNDALHAAEGWKGHGMANAKEASDLYDEASKFASVNAVPDAPFKKNWHELAMKRLLNYAADNGYDSIALTPGAEQAKRFSLSQHVEKIDYFKNPNGTYNFVAYSKQNHPLVHKTDVGFDELGNYVGTEVAQKIADAAGAPRPANLGIGKIGNNWEIVDAYGETIEKHKTKRDAEASLQQIQSSGGTLKNIDLEVGGEGMKGFYDKMLPDYLNNYGKSYGAKVEMNSIPVSTRDPRSTGWDSGQGDHPFTTSQDLSEPFDGMVELFRRNPETGEHDLVGRMLRADSERRIAQELQKLDTANQIKLHNFPITPEMRESIKQKGLPLYQQVGIPTAGAGAASQALEPEEEAGLAGGGSVAKLAALAKMKKLKEEMTPRAEAVKALIARDQNSYLRDVVPNSLTNPEIEAEIARLKAKSEALQPEVKEAKGGKVTMTKNRDTMFMELSNKKLKRK
jgi:hypothetical protein